MKTTVTARNLEITERLRTEIERKLRRLDRVADHRGAQASVELIAHASHASEQANVAEVTLHANGSILRSTSSGPTPMAAFDTVLDKLERQAIRSKQRRRSVRERVADEVDQVLAREAVGTTIEGPGETAEAPGPAIVKIKRFDMVPMFEEDAIARMEELGHEFFVFLNAESEQIAVLYRRRDGDYGVIEPAVETRGRGR